nr:retrovirus-related Pol polyprotein from transposon TNT 1-94 [Tanacetum cinerariifolium]
MLMATLNSKEIKERYKANGGDGEGLYVREELIVRIHASQGESQDRSLEALLDWIMDLGCSYHMTPMLDILFDFLECDGGSVQLGDNRECKVRGIGKGFAVKLQSGKVKVINGSRVVLSGIRRNNYVYSLDGHAMVGELKASVKEKDSLAQVWCKKAYYSRSDRLGSFRLMESVSSGIIKRRLCIESGIARHLTVVEKSHQHRLAKHMNKTLMDKVHSLLIQSGFPKTFWAEGTCTTAYLINRSPSTAIEKKIPMKMWSGHLSNYGMLRIFGCVAYPHDKQAEKEDTHEPLTYQKAVTCEDSSKWKAGMKEEMDSQMKNKTWELVDYPARQKLVSCKWLFKIMKGIEGVQKPSTRQDYELEQLDVKTAFLHENLEEVIYMRQPLGYEQDDMLIACKSKAEIGSDKSLLEKEFDMKELEEAKKILGMEFVRDRSRKILRVSQSGYVYKILNNFRIDNGKSVKMPLDEHFKLSLKDCPVRDCDVERMSKVPYANAVGSLMYLTVCTRPDIAYAVSVVSRYLTNPGKNYWEAVKWILKYLRGTTNASLVYGTDRGNHVDLTSFVDLDYAKDLDKCMSITEAEYMALIEAVKEAIWLRRLLEELGVELNIVTVNCDNQGMIHLSRNHVFHERTKHINVRYHFIREVLKAKTVKVLKVSTEHNAEDALTKVVPELKLQHCLELLNVVDCGRALGKENHATSPMPKAPTFQKDKSVSSGNVMGFKQPNIQYHGGSNVTISTPPFLLKPNLVLDDSCLVNKELVNCVMGEVLQFSSINNLRVLLSNEGFHNARIVYLGGLWVMIELQSSKTKLKFMQHVGVASWFCRLCNAQSDFAAKERIVWVGDENSKYFHAIINKKHVNLFVKGVMIDGDWIDDPDLVKQDFRSHFADRFQDPGSRRGLPGFDDLVTKSWNSFVLDDSNGMIRFKKKLQMLKKEIRTWTLDYKRQHIGHSKDLKSKLSDIDKMLDQGGVTDDILLSRMEVLKQLHDVDFAKAYDSIRWNILDDVLISFVFGSKWRSCIRGSLSSGKAS